MDPSNALNINETFLDGIFHEAGLAETPEVNHQRVEKVLERAMHEKLIADTTSFVFKGFPAAADAAISLANRTVGNDDTDYRS